MKYNRVSWLGFVLLVSSCVFGQICDNWIFRNPLPQGNLITSMTHDGSEYWAVGKFGLIMSSPDGQNWSIKVNAEADHPSDIVYTHLGYTVVSEDGLVRTSPDGEVWTQVAQLSPGSPMRGIAYGNGLFVAVGPASKTYRSADQIVWEECALSISDFLYDVVFDGVQFIATGRNGTIGTSIDGCAWNMVEQVNGVTGILYDIEYLNGIYIAVGDSGTVLTSTDLLTWTDAPIPDSYRLKGSFFWDNRYFVFGSRVYVSPLATNWTQAHTFTKEMTSIAMSGSQILTGGEGGHLNYSSDGLTWNLNSGFLRGIIYGIVYGNGRYVTTTSSTGKILSSTDGTLWGEILTGVTVNSMAVATIGSEFLAVGQQGKIATSSDGLTWTEQVSPTSVSLREISYDGTTTVVVGDDGVILYSSNLVTWTLADTGAVTETLLTVTNGPGGTPTRFVALGLNGVILHSPNGQVWTPAISSGLTSEVIYSVVAFGNKYVAVGAHGLILSSHSGDTWVPQVSGVTTNLFHILHDGGTYRVFGTNQTGLVSEDAITWHSVIRPMWSDIRGSTQVGERIFCVGSNGPVVEIEMWQLPCQEWLKPLDIRDFIDDFNSCGP